MKNLLLEETVIVDGMGYFCDAHKCNPEMCQACPYWRDDIDGDMACYDDDRKEICNYLRDED